MDKKKLIEMIVNALTKETDEFNSAELMCAIQATLIKTYMEDHEVKITIKNFDGLHGINVQIESDLPKDFPDKMEIVGYIAQQGYVSITVDMLNELSKKHNNGEKMSRETLEEWVTENLKAVKKQIIERYLEEDSEEGEEENDG